MRKKTSQAVASRRKRWVRLARERRALRLEHAMERFGWRQIDVICAGRTMRELSERFPHLADRYLAQRYEVLAHQAGLEDEGPSVAYPEDEQPNGDRVMKEGSVVCLEVYAGEVGGTDGVKLEEQVVVTEGEPRILVPYPFSETLL